jgi:hypothetical protein
MVQTVGTKYGLHVDTMGQVSEAITNMLLGLESPLQFQTELAAFGIPDGTADAIIQELNENVFKPLRDEVRNTPPEQPEEEEAELVDEPVQIPVAVTPAPVPPPLTPIPPPQPTVPAAEVAPPVPASAPTPTPTPAPQPAPTRPVIASVPSPVPQMPTETPRPALTPRPVPQNIQANKEALHEVLKKYGVDPYREIPE